MVMTYLTFLVLLVFLPALGLAFLARPARREWIVISLLAVAAYVWTTPWDNYLVATGVWSYDPNLVLGIALGWVPLEEYLFFGIMTVLSGCLTLLLVRWLAPRVGLARLLAGLVGLVLLAGLSGLSLEPSPAGARPWTYLILILAWSAPIVLGQILLGWRSLINRWPLWFLGVMIPTLYLTAIDSIALHAGTWRIDPAQSLNLLLPGGVPLEEGVFFLMTNLMIVQGLLLAFAPETRQRITQLYRSILRPAANEKPGTEG